MLHIKACYRARPHFDSIELYCAPPSNSCITRSFQWGISTRSLFSAVASLTTHTNNSVSREIGAGIPSSTPWFNGQADAWHKTQANKKLFRYFNLSPLSLAWLACLLHVADCCFYNCAYVSNDHFASKVRSVRIWSPLTRACHEKRAEKLQKRRLLAYKDIRENRTSIWCLNGRIPSGQNRVATIGYLMGAAE